MNMAAILLCLANTLSMRLENIWNMSFITRCCIKNINLHTLMAGLCITALHSKQMKRNFHERRIWRKKFHDILAEEDTVSNQEKNHRASFSRLLGISGEYFHTIITLFRFTRTVSHYNRHSHA